jgi:hypothetical protein
MDAPQEGAAPNTYVMTFAMQSPVLGAGARPLGTFRLPFLPRAGDFYVLPDSSQGVVQQVRFELKEDGIGILVVVGVPRGQG